jgi:hypothetical protein
MDEIKEILAKIAKFWNESLAYLGMIVAVALLTLGGLLVYRLFFDKNMDFSQTSHLQRKVKIDPKYDDNKLNDYQQPVVEEPQEQKNNFKEINFLSVSRKESQKVETEKSAIKPKALIKVISFEFTPSSNKKIVKKGGGQVVTLSQTLDFIRVGSRSSNSSRNSNYEDENIDVPSWAHDEGKIELARKFWRNYHYEVETVCRETGLDPKLLAALVTVESSGDINAYNPSTATGLTQIKPGTARDVGMLKISDPLNNLRAGARYLAKTIRTFNGNEADGLFGYRWGEEGARSRWATGKTTSASPYVKKVLYIKAQL